MPQRRKKREAYSRALHVELRVSAAGGGVAVAVADEPVLQVLRRAAKERESAFLRRMLAKRQRACWRRHGTDAGVREQTVGAEKKLREGDGRFCAKR